MMINEHEAILTSRVLLVPYCTHHVPTYHSWMQDEEIQKATASEPLTFTEEHSMQQSWRLDHDKLTFIACRSPNTLRQDETSAINEIIRPKIDDAPENMIGDVNLFLYEDEDEEDTAPPPANPIIGELEIMIAHIPSRGQGLAYSTLLGFLWYISTHLAQILEEYRLGSEKRSERYLKYLRVKIDQHNVKSLALFRKVGFERVGEVNYFGEVEMRTEVLEGRLVDSERRRGVEGVARKAVYGS